MQILMQIFDIEQSFRQVVEIVKIFAHILPQAWPTFGEKISQIGHQTANHPEKTNVVVTLESPFSYYNCTIVYEINECQKILYSLL